MDELISWRWLLFGFSGRINRAEYWFAMLVYFLAGIVLAGIVYLLGDGVTAQGVRFVTDLAVAVSGLAVMAKRFHDRDKSAWWVLVFYGAQTILIVLALGAGFMASRLGDMAAEWAFLFRLCVISAIAIGLWFFVELGFLRGSRGYNRYGPDSVPATAASAGRRR